MEVGTGMGWGWEQQWHASAAGKVPEFCGGPAGWGQSRDPPLDPEFGIFQGEKPPIPMLGLEQLWVELGCGSVGFFLGIPSPGADPYLTPTTARWATHSGSGPGWNGRGKSGKKTGNGGESQTLEAAPESSGRGEGFGIWRKLGQGHPIPHPQGREFQLGMRIPA